MKVTYDDDHGNSGELFDPGFLDDLDEAIEVGSAVSDDIFAGAYDDIFYSKPQSTTPDSLNRTWVNAVKACRVLLLKLHDIS